jgi:hypothetical protein
MREAVRAWLCRHDAFLMSRSFRTQFKPIHQAWNNTMTRKTDTMAGSGQHGSEKPLKIRPPRAAQTAMENGARNAARHALPSWRPSWTLASSSSRWTIGAPTTHHPHSGGRCRHEREAISERAQGGPGGRQDARNDWVQRGKPPAPCSACVWRLRRWRPSLRPTSSR